MKDQLPEKIGTTFFNVYEVDHALSISDYASAMSWEMERNKHKGDPQMQCNDAVEEPADDESQFAELLYHAFKLAIAMQSKNKGAVQEYAADVGNCAWFIAQRHKALDASLLATGLAIEYRDEAVASKQTFKRLKDKATTLAKNLLLIKPGIHEEFTLETIF